MKIVIANSNPVHSQIESICEAKYGAVTIHSKDELTSKRLASIKPDYVFFLHWSYLIPSEIYDHFKCVVFHMTDLPFGRGGSPLQNLIVRGYRETVISAIRVEKGIDTGPIYLKKPLSLAGSAEEIFIRAGHVMLQMIEEIVTKKPEATEQKGEIIYFTRRTPNESNIAAISNIQSLYDHIRMLDAPGYPRAFLETEHLRLEFSEANINNGEVTANVKITRK